MNRRHMQIEFIQIWPVEINGKFKILIEEACLFADQLIPEEGP
jgi:hypothetical protein